MSRLIVFLECAGIWTLFHLVDDDASIGRTLGLILGAGCALTLHWLQEKLK